ncbi:hypothetical protein OBV_24700 [Oscillibacter valericigenes Sjm18-20]|nr:hypothetical protein OBV_24700 [Oscillibacter valericigenes Sjm18-20]
MYTEQINRNFTTEIIYIIFIITAIKVWYIYTVKQCRKLKLQISYSAMNLKTDTFKNVFVVHGSELIFQYLNGKNGFILITHDRNIKQILK